MKLSLLGVFCLSVLVAGCQTYPKHPTSPKTWGKIEPVNRFVPHELRPYEVPPKVAYVDEKNIVPKQIIVVKEN
ncbi:hypothetical protein LP109_14590 (plasmid) [Moraxella bovis]|uniref:Uncharacterized protein n=1 Tax=Moraxella bovis TaxID=476 RepID=A0ABY6MBF6_MORBO|nr:hypothetical protein [Moraxella bovis]UYZ77113.1 hypothetical protein LP093_14035 [Moraxella bovis]UYZ79770.1 hypothetical protein LP115_14165 [Moraxella bovis]UYZ88268.1 hypothetical protein LP094_14105 [Moraxella bovis]UYZ90986.1 hypothetical protein LP114_14430 [Moraxella bovis]UYZ99210.1 hypothetical protein LP107_14150 [Moraxella bovis]